jgi:hypothetical protein
MKAYEISHSDFYDFVVVVAAKNAAKAKAMVASSLINYSGYTFLEAVKGMTCRRQKKWDAWAKETTLFVVDEVLLRTGVVSCP